jgi:hypothetical protein
MANVAFTISPAPGVTNDLIAVLYEISPSGGVGAEIARQEKSEPHPSPHDFNFANVVPKTYIVKIHESTAPGSGLLGILRHDFWVDASLQKTQSYEVKTFQVGAGRGTPYYDPADLDTDYINPDLDGLTYTVFKPGYGPLDWDANINPYSGGGFSFIDGQIFSQDEIYTVLVSNLIVQPVAQVGGGYPDDVVVITADTAFGSSHYNKLLVIDSVSALLTITIADITAIPDGTVWGINTQKHNDALRYATLQLPGGASCYINGIQRAALYLGRAEEIWVYKKGSELRIINWDGDYRRVGDKVYRDGIPPFNGLQLTGGWILKTDYPRLFNWYVNTLPGGVLGAATQDTTPDADNITKWIIGPTKFWYPKYEELFIRGASGSRLSGSYQEDDNKAHNHTSPGLWNKLGAKASDVGGYGTPAGLDSSNASTEYRVGTMTGGEWDDATIKDQGTEARPKNVAQNIYVII